MKFNKPQSSTKGQKELVIEGIKIIRNYPKSKLARRSKNSGYKDWSKILQAMKVGDIAVIASRNFWHSARYQADKLGMEVELHRFDDTNFAVLRTK